MARDWQNHDVNAPVTLPRGGWTVGPEMAHYVWTLTERTPEVGWGSDPPILLEALMGFFPDSSESDPINSWFFTRKPGVALPDRFSPEYAWWQVDTRHPSPDKSVYDGPKSTSVTYDPNDNPNPARSRLHSQQYTANGALFTFEFTQWTDEEPFGYARIPTSPGLLDDLDAAVTALPFERFQYQSRGYQSDKATEPIPESSEYEHPHYRPVAGETPTIEDYKDLFDVAFEYMRRMVRSQR